MKHRTIILSSLLFIVSIEGAAQNAEKKSTTNQANEVTISQDIEMGDTITLDSVIIAKPEPPKDRIDTIYYTKAWKTIGTKAFANYYRLALYPADSLAQRFFKTYYISGELQGEGCFVSLDEKDDARSVMDGEITNYFKNGKVSEKLFFIQGIADKEHTIYYDNGNIKEHYSLLLGKKNGIASSFTEDGKVCKLILYKEDLPSAFYVMTDMDGNYSKYDMNTNQPIFETPAINEIQTEYKNGVAWPYYNKNGLIVGVSNSFVNDIGKYRQIGIFVVNKSMVKVELDPSQVEICFIKKNKEYPMELMTPEEYDKKSYKIRKKNIEKKIKQKAVVAIEKENNINANLGASVFNAGTSNTVGTFQESIIKLTELIGENRMRYAEGKLEDLGYLERTTVHPSEIVSGFLYTANKKVDHLVIRIKIEGVTYTYEWKNMKK